MRILKLTLQAFGPFLETQTIDFATSGDSLLLIAGPTGAGKSSLLDGVCFALYGTVPRYDGLVDQVRSHHASPEQETVARLEFEIHGVNYRVERSPKWKKPGRKNEVPQKAKLWRQDGDQWQGIAEKPSVVAEKLQGILPLNAKQFLQVVMLAQGGFQKFLKAQPADRQDTLRNLFDTRLYAMIEETLDDRRKELESKSTGVSIRVDTLARTLYENISSDAQEFLRDGEFTAEAPGADLGDTAIDPAGVAQRAAEVTEQLRQREKTQVNTLEQLNHTRDLALQKLSAAQELRRLQARKQQAETSREALERQRPDTEEKRARVERSRLAAPVVPLIRAVEQGEQKAALAAENIQRTVTELKGFVAQTRVPETQIAASLENIINGAVAKQLTAEPLREISSDAAQTLASARSALEGVAQLPALEQKLVSLRETLGEQRQRIAEADREIAAQPELLRELREELEVVNARAALRDSHEKELEEAQTVREAAEQLEQQRVAVAETNNRYAQSLALAAQKNSALENLVRQRFAGIAGELAKDLVAGKPCSVCGSPQHPAPATADSQVTEADVEAAEAEAAAAETERDKHREQLHESKTELARLETAAKGLTTSAAALAYEAAAQKLRDTVAAHSRAAGLRLRIDEVEAAHTRLQADRAALAEETQELDTQLRSAAQQREEIHEEEKAATGEWDSLEAKASMYERLVSCLSELDEQLKEQRRVTADAADADAELVAKLAQSDFENREAVTAAALSEQEYTEQLEEVQRFDREWHATHATLAEAELQNLPTETPDIEALQQQHEAAMNRAQQAEHLGKVMRRVLQARTAELTQLREALENAEAALTELRQMRQLSDTVRGHEPNTKRIRLEAYVLAARLEAIVEAANRRLQTITAERYQLRHDDGQQSRGRQSGLGLRVFDSYSGTLRSTDSLSGGETFLASLALALGLADVVSAESGGVQLDTLFIDEGFGSLDSEALDEAMTMLDNLRAGGRTVAVISHVREMHDRIPNQIIVRKNPQGTSYVEGAGVSRRERT